MGNKALNPYTLFDDCDPRDFRIDKSLDHWGKGQYMDPPEIALDWSNTIYIADGRHRTIVAWHLKEQSIPVAVPDNQIAVISSKINLQKANGISFGNSCPQCLQTRAFF